MNEQEYLCWFCTLRNERHIIYFVVQSMHSNMLGWHGGLARVQLCWILAKYSPLHHTSCSEIVHVRKLRFCVGSVSFFVASIHLPSCSLRNMISFVHRHMYDMYELFDHFLKIWTDFWTLTVDRRVFSSWSSLLFSHSCLKCAVFLSNLFHVSFV